MSAFLQDILHHAFLRHAVLAAALASVACGIVGSYVVVRRTTYIAGAISHSVLGGMGLARYLQRVHGVAWMTPLLGATLAAILVALLVAAVTLRSRQRVDTILSAIWALGMALGVSFVFATPGYGEDLMSYLFGNILMVSRGDLVLMSLLNLAVVLAALLAHNRILVISFDPDLARRRGVHVAFHETLFLILTALTVVLLVQVVGVVLVIALLTLPAATANFFTRRLSAMIVLSIGLCLLVTLGGLALSYGPDLPVGATIIETAGLLYLLAALGAWLRRRRADVPPPPPPDPEEKP